MNAGLFTINGNAASTSNEGSSWNGESSISQSVKFEIDTTAISEPSILALFGLGFGFARRKRMIGKINHYLCLRTGGSSEPPFALVATSELGQERP